MRFFLMTNFPFYSSGVSFSMLALLTIGIQALGTTQAICCMHRVQMEDNKSNTRSSFGALSESYSLGQMILVFLVWLEKECMRTVLEISLPLQSVLRLSCSVLIPSVQCEMAESQSSC